MIAGTPWLVAVVIFCHGHGAIAQARYLVGMDGTLSASMGAENLIAIHRAVYALQDRALKPKLFDETTKARKSAGILYRLGKTALLDNVINHLPALVQHEVFGHGARFREFGYKEISYRFSLFPPYGSGTGRAAGSLDPARRGTRHEGISVNISGSEANTLLSTSIRSKWLRRGRVRSRETVIYLASSLDLSWYIWTTRLASRQRSGNDVINYLDNLNRQEGGPGRFAVRPVQLARANDGRRETDLPGRRSMDIIRTRGRRHRWPPV